MTLYIFHTFLSGGEIIAVFEIDELEFFFLVEILFPRVLLVVSSILLECSLEPVDQVVHLGLQNLYLILLKELFDDTLKIF